MGTGVWTEGVRPAARLDAIPREWQEHPKRQDFTIDNLRVEKDLVES